MVLRHGPRKMPVLYTHLMPGTFGGRARMNVANALAAAAAAWAAGRPPPRHPPGPADVHDVVLPGAGPAQPGRGGGHARGHRLLPQRGRDAAAGRLRQPDDGRAADAGGRARRAGAAVAHPHGPGGRSASSASRATAATRTSASTAPWRRRAFDEIIIREDRNLRGRAPGESATNVADGARAARGEGGGPGRQGREDPGRGGRRAGGAAPRAAGRPRGGVRGRCRGRLPRGDDAGRPRRRRRRRSRIRASSRRRWASWSAVRPTSTVAGDRGWAGSGRPPTGRRSPRGHR